MRRPKAWSRYKSYVKAKRKMRLDYEISYYPMYNNLHQYSKNKIHCSCPMCSAKTKKNRHRTYHGHFSWSHHIPGPYNYSVKDMRRQIMMDEDEKEYFIGTSV